MINTDIKIETQWLSNGKRMYSIFLDDLPIGKIFETYHTSIPFEAFTASSKNSKRVSSIEAGIDFLKQNNDQNRPPK